jgi:predicted glycogen debranching enzyme
MDFGTQVCGDLAESAAREWLVPDGLGGYAMGTVGGLRTRRYHGLLIISGPQPGVRRLALAALDPVVEVDGTRVELAVHEWASGAIRPAGNRYLSSFRLVDGLPVWRWRIGAVVIERRLAMVPGRPVVAVVHQQLAGPPVRLTLAALCAWRDAHAEQRGDEPLPQAPTVDGCMIAGGYRIAGPNFAPDGRWFTGVRLREETARGLADTEDLWCAGRFSRALEPGAALEVTAWAGDLNDAPPPASHVVQMAAARNRAVVAAAKPVDALDATLALAADAFVVGGPDVVAGYPWFGAWSRDTMISYEGLFLTGGRAAEGRELLRRYCGQLSDGLLPNTTDTADAGGATDFHSNDAPLWLVHAVERHVTATGDTDLAAELRPALVGLLDRYPVTGGLPRTGSAETSMTWMDARVGGVPVTPRPGTPIEIAALWINALGAMPALEAAVKARGDNGFAGRAAEAVAAFDAVFGSGPLLPDVVTDSQRDWAVRPNQIFAYALPYGPRCGQPVPFEVAAALATPLGLRTLAPADPAYRGAHRGDPASRDTAYHQGTVWPWLLGPYDQALAAAGQPRHGLLDGLLAHLSEYGLGSVSETADGDAPHGATGCPFQAWSVAQLWSAYRRG